MRLLIPAILLTLALVCRAEPHPIAVDFASSLPDLRPLHGINKGPLAANGLIDVTDLQKQLRIPFTRLHDCQFPNPAVVDIHAIFPNPDADPALPDNYDFRSTDEYIAAVRATGAEVIYRLGESIEHQKVKRHVHPPKDPARWAAVCAGIVRHYNEGWAGGFRYGIRYWEIWNEPENRPVMWTGTDAQFLELYKATARTLREQFPAIKIGGPGFGSCGSFDGTSLQPSGLCSAFLDLCRGHSLPLDFFSWHCYAGDPSEFVARAKAVRRLLDARGFTKTESHLNEWNYLPGNSWDVVSPRAAPELRQRAVEQMSGTAGAAFIAASLIEFQDAPVDVANFFHGETGIFGLMTEVGAPTRNYYGLKAFAQMLETPKRLSTTGGVPGKLAVLAGTNTEKTKASVLIANPGGPESARLSLTNFPPWFQGSVEVKIVNAEKSLEPVAAKQGKERALELPMRPPCVVLVEWRRDGTR